MRVPPAASTLPQRTSRLVVMVATAVLLSAALFQPVRALATAPTLGTLVSHAVAAGTTVTNTGPTVITGDLSLHPGTATTGFPPGSVSGAINTNQPGGVGIAAVALQAKNDLDSAYLEIDGQLCDTNYPDAFDLVGLTLPPGVYCSPSSLFLSGTLILDAQFDPNAVWIFQSETSTLITASNSTVDVINEGRDCNVYWKVGSSATLGTNTTFVGNILALTSIGLNTGATVSGRVLARNGAVTLDSNTISITACTAAAPPPPEGDRASLALSKTPDRTTYTAVGDSIVYTYMLKNTGTTPLTGPFTVTDDKLGAFTCGTSLAPGETVTCTRTYQVQLGDFGDESSFQGVTANIDTGPWLQFKRSTQDTKITGAGPGVTNGTYPCWCVQDHVPTDLHNQPAMLFSTVGGSLPADVASLAWNKVNYTLNHKIRGAGRSNLGFLKDVQTAIWVALGEPNPEFGVSAAARKMINAANANANFVPGPGDIVAVLVYSDGILPIPAIRPGEVQESVCEVDSKLKSIVNTATAATETVVSNQVQATVKQINVIQ